MLRCRIVGRSLQWTKRSLTSDAALQLLLDFLCGTLFERVCATSHGQPRHDERDREGLHPHIL